jgi:hypothetical protein
VSRFTEPYIAVPKRLAARTDLSAIAKLVWASIRERVGLNACAWPGYARIALDVGCERKTALKAVVELERAGELRVSRRRGRPNRYYFPTSPQNGLVDQSQKRTRTTYSEQQRERDGSTGRFNAIEHIRRVPMEARRRASHLPGVPEAGREGSDAPGCGGCPVAHRQQRRRSVRPCVLAAGACEDVCKVTRRTFRQVCAQRGEVV